MPMEANGLQGLCAIVKKKEIKNGNYSFTRSYSCFIPSTQGSVASVEVPLETG